MGFGARVVSMVGAQRQYFYVWFSACSHRMKSRSISRGGEMKLAASKVILTRNDYIVPALDVVDCFGSVDA